MKRKKKLIFVLALFTGGRIQSAYYYTEGERTHKLFKASYRQQSEEMKDNDLLSVNLVDHSLFAPSYYTDWESDVYYCAFCGSYHTYDGDGCEVVIEWCSKCNKPMDAFSDTETKMFKEIQTIDNLIILYNCK